jgi:hypothetical protein
MAWLADGRAADVQDFPSPRLETGARQAASPNDLPDAAQQPSPSRPWGQLPWQEGFAEPRDVPREYRRREWEPAPWERRAWDYGSARERPGDGAAPYGGPLEGPPSSGLGRSWTYRDRYYGEPAPSRPPRYGYGGAGPPWRAPRDVVEGDWEGRRRAEEYAGERDADQYDNAPPEPPRRWRQGPPPPRLGRGAPYYGGDGYPYAYSSGAGGLWDPWPGWDRWGSYGGFYGFGGWDAAPWDPWFGDSWLGPYW